MAKANNVKKVKGLKSSKKLNMKFVIPGVIAIALIGGFMVFRSFAAAPTYVKTYVDSGLNLRTTKTTPDVMSKDGWLCVATDINKYNTPYAGSYVWTIEKKYASNRYGKIDARSRKMGSNGNKDTQCFSPDINKNEVFRLRFNFENAQAHGNVWMYGYNKGWR